MLLIASLAIARGNVPRFRFHPITPYAVIRPFLAKACIEARRVEVVAPIAEARLEHEAISMYARSSRYVFNSINVSSLS